ncbi:MAG: hypothetical protein R2939_08120 [Kofleriaceae bacterium]
MLAALVVTAGAGCRTAAPATVSVVGVRNGQAEHATDILFVQVVNRAARPMRLERIEYTFGAAASPGAPGHIRVGREVAAGGSIVIELPVDLLADDGDAIAAGPMHLEGRVFATLDTIEQSFPVSAMVAAPVGSPAEVELQADGAEPASAPR